jgi:IS30 family transposase
MYNRNLRKTKKDKLSVRAMARELGLPNSTLQRDLKRGLLERPNLREGKEFLEYSAWKAQDDVDEGAGNKGAPMRMTNILAKQLKTKIKDECKSPNHARNDLIAERCAYVPSLSSIYNHIERGDIGVEHGETPYHPKRRRKRKDPVHRAYKMPGNLSIEDRPDISQRDEFGHWEMDCIVSGIGGKGGLLVLIERKTRMYLTVRLGRITQAAVLHAIKALIRSGRMKAVLSITTDNGSEFLDSVRIEALFAKIDKTVKVYYTHAYAAWEKGSVENANRHVRRFYPKGSDFSRLTRRQVEELQDFINSIPRPYSLKGLTAHEAFRTAA